MITSTDRQVHIFPNIKHLLVFIGVLCDTGFIVTFRIKDVTVMYKINIILRGWINHQNKLWYLPPETENKYKKVGDYKNNLAKNVYKNKAQEELASLLHATYFSSVK